MSIVSIVIFPLTTHSAFFHSSLPSLTFSVFAKSNNFSTQWRCWLSFSFITPSRELIFCCCWRFLFTKLLFFFSISLPLSLTCSREWFLNSLSFFFAILSFFFPLFFLLHSQFTWSMWDPAGSWGRQFWFSHHFYLFSSIAIVPYLDLLGILILHSNSDLQLSCLFWLHFLCLGYFSFG